MLAPYIGITDFTSAGQVRRMANAFRRCGGPALRRKLAVGVMMSRKTLLELPTKWADVFPAKETIKDIFTDDPDVLNVLHYADYDDESQEQEFDFAAELAGGHLHALQLDMPWPEPTAVEIFRWYYPKTAVILQVGANAMDACNNDPDAVAGRITEYGDTIDAVLLDKSMGRGLGMDAAALLPFADTIATRHPRLALAAAGGLGPDTLHLIKPFLTPFPAVSIDAQSKLRPSGNAMDPVDWDMAELYVERAVAMFTR